VLGLRGEVLARNALLRAVLGHPMPPGSSFTDYLFRDPLARQRIVNWPEFAASSVAAMRMGGRRPRKPRSGRYREHAQCVGRAGGKHVLNLTRDVNPGGNRGEPVA
jgi:hypothetical protein